MRIGLLLFYGAMTLAGQVIAERGNLPLDVQVELRPVPSGWISGDLDALERFYVSLRRTMRPAADGTFAFTGLTPGWFIVRATAAGLVAETPEPVVLAEGEATPAVRLALRRDAELRLQITPFRDGEGHPWVVALTHGFLDSEHGVADGAGRWLRSGLLPGDYFLEVRQDRGIHIWERRRVRITPGMPAVAVDLQPLVLEGRVTRAGSPLRASILFRGQDQSLVSWIDAALDGSFQGELPRSGSWVVEIVDWQQQPPRREVHEIDIPWPAGSERAHLELQLPAVPAGPPRLP